MAEVMVVFPLSGEEVQEAILYRIKESMAKTCHLLQSNGYTSFRAEIEIHISLSDHGTPVFDNHKVIAQEDTGLEGIPQPEREIEFTIEPAPPNDVRIETHQKVPIEATVDGKKVIKWVRYAPRAKPAPVDPPLTS